MAEWNNLCHPVCSCPKHVHPPVIVVHIAARRSPAPIGGQSIRQGLESGFSKENQDEHIFSSDFSKSANTEAAGGDWKDIFQCCSAGPEEVYDHPLCQSCLEILSQNFISVYFPAVTLRTRVTREHFNGASGEMIT